MNLIRVNLFYMSIQGGILILTVLFLRLLLKNKLPKRTFSVLWCVALLRLLTPLSVDSPFGVFSMIQDQMQTGRDHGAAGGEDRLTVLPAELFSERLSFGNGFGFYEAIGGRPDDGTVAGMEGSPADGRLSDNGFLQGPGKLSLFRRMGTAGTVVCAAVFLALYLGCLRRFKTALPVEDPSVRQLLDRSRLFRKVRVRQSDRIFSPLTYGLVRPVILLPKHLERENGRKLEYILQHEMVHIRRFDGVWKLAMAAALCLHWFNPMVWVMYVFMNRDLELSCDEAVLRIFGVEARKGYALTLIGMEEHRHLSAPLYSGFGKNAVEERIGEIMKYKKKTKLAMCAGAALILTVACMFATIVKAEGEPSGADAVLSENVVNTALPMDPPAGYSGEKEGADGTGSGTDSNADMKTVDGTEQPAGDITELPANGESGYRLTYIKEGFPESEPARLVTGQGYCILLPEEGWTAFGPDGWMNEENNEVRLWVAHFSAADSDYHGCDREQIIEALKGKCYQEAENGRLYMEAEDRMTVVEFCQTDEQDIWGIYYTYPSEAEDGRGVELRAMAQTFSVGTSELSGSMSGEGETDVYRETKVQELEIAEWLLQKLIKAAGEENHDSILPYIAEGYEVDAAELDRITEWRQKQIDVRLHPTGDRCVASIQVKTQESGEDSNDYLTVELVKEGDDWKICFMGMEK